MQNPFSFCNCQFRLPSQPFPHRLFTDTELTTTLVELGLSAGGSLVVKKRDVNPPSSLSGKAGDFLSSIVVFNDYCLLFVSIVGDGVA